MYKKTDQQQKYYFPEKLKKQLSRILEYPLTIVEAPSGFGKTTAVREYLNENLPQDSVQYWYTSLGEPGSIAWMGICELFSNVSIGVADDLQNLKMATMETLFRIASYLRGISCERETWLVIDNYQLVDCKVSRELISVFSMHGNPKLHIVFITQQLGVQQRFSIHNNNIHTITAASFFFDRESTACLFRMQGIRLTGEELEKLFFSTEGWVSAIHLQLINYQETGSFDFNSDIEHLVETAIWDKLSLEEKNFLLSVSILDGFNARQAAIMLEEEVLPENIEELLKTNDFINYLPNKALYSMHSILQDYLRNRFCYLQPEEYQNRTYRKAGAACAAISQYFPAAGFYYKVKDFKTLMSLNFSLEYLSEHKEEYDPSQMMEILMECPDEVLCEHPLTMIVFAYEEFACGQTEPVQRLCTLLEKLIREKKAITAEGIRIIEGEYKLMQAIFGLADDSGAEENINDAWDILKSKSLIVRQDMPWTLSGTSMLNTYWTKAGDLERRIRQADELLPVYLRLTGGHGAGSNSLMRAEALFMRGEEAEAEIYCHKAFYEARGYKQICICISGEMLLARMAVLKGDVEAFWAAAKNIQKYAQENSGLHVQRMAEHCMSFLSLLIGVKDWIAPWLYDMSEIKKLLYAPAVPFATVLHLYLLLMEKRYKEFYALCELTLEREPGSAEATGSKMQRLYLLILMASAKYDNGEQLDAQQYLREALHIAVKDRIYMPFSQRVGIEELLFELPVRRAEDAENGIGKESIAAITALCKRQQNGVNAIRKGILQNKSPLTSREREVAQLARERLSAKEIGDMLYISEMTVRTTLRNIYSKLNIHSKSELLMKEF
ncbi:MAG: LuxR C-terminal-related transcriptional regulator [Lachnospiraceae bacterium]